MCDYSLHNVRTRKAAIGDKVVTTLFPNSLTKGLQAIREPGVAVCLLPGTEVAFDQPVTAERTLQGVFGPWKLGQSVAKFTQINLNNPLTHHDALEFPDGQTVLINNLLTGQHATVLQLPAAGEQPAEAAKSETSFADRLHAALDESKREDEPVF